MMEHALPVSLQDAVEGLADTVHAGRTREIRSLMIRLACMFNDEAVLLRIVDSAAANVLRRHTPPAYRAVSINQLAVERERVPALVAAARAVLERDPERQRQILRRDRLDRAWRPLADHVAALLPERHARMASLGMRLDHGLRIALGADRGRYLALAGRLLAGPSRLVEIARESLLPLADPPPGAGSRLGVLRPGELVAMQADARLVEAWRPGGGHRFAAQAARAAEHLMRIWLQARFADAQVHDLSICQVQGASGMPAAVAAALGRLGVGAAALEWPVALPADAAVLQDTTGAVSFYDAKNTVKSGHHLEIFVRGDKLNRPGVTFVAIWTDGWIRADQREALEALERPTGPTPHRASRDLNAVRLSVLGELDSASLAAFLRFRDQAAPRVGVGAPARVSDWAVEAGCMLPGLFFAYPEDAHAEGGAHRGEAMRTARLASLYLRTLPASILGALATGTRIEDPVDPLEREVAAWFVARLRLRDPSRRAAPPALGEMYLLTLQIFLEFLECRKAGAGPDEDRLPGCHNCSWPSCCRGARPVSPISRSAPGIRPAASACWSGRSTAWSRRRAHSPDCPGSTASSSRAAAPWSRPVPAGSALP